MGSPRLRSVADAPGEPRKSPLTVEPTVARASPHPRWAGGPVGHGPKVPCVCAPVPRAGFRPPSYAPDMHVTRHARLAGLTALCLAAAALLGGCAGTAPASFDPSAACGGADVQRVAGMYPDLEARLPATLDGRSPTIRDSGRYCSRRTLGPLLDAGHDEVRFAGSTFQTGGQAGMSLVAYEAPGLTADEMAAAFRAGAASGRRVQVVSDAERVVDGRPGRRLELINGDARQVVFVWPDAAPDRVLAVIGSDVSNADMDAAVATFARVPEGS
jgi:hypothetical protein